MPTPDLTPVPGEVRFIAHDPHLSRVPDVAIFDPRHLHYDGDRDEAVALSVDPYPWRTLRGRVSTNPIWFPDGEKGVDWYRLRPLADGEDLDDMVVPGWKPDGTGGTTSIVRIDPTRTHVALYFPDEPGNQHRAACKGGREAHWVASFGDDDDDDGREPDDRVWLTDDEVADWTPMVVDRAPAHPATPEEDPAPVRRAPGLYRDREREKSSGELSALRAEVERLADERDAYIARFVALGSPGLRTAVAAQWPDHPESTAILGFVRNWAEHSAETPEQPLDGLPFLVAQELETLRAQAQVWIRTCAGLQRSLWTANREHEARGLALRQIEEQLNLDVHLAGETLSRPDRVATRTAPMTADDVRDLVRRNAQRLATLNGDVREWQARTSDLLDVVREHTGVRPDDDADAARIASTLLKPMAEAVEANIDLELSKDRSERAAAVFRKLAGRMAQDNRDWHADRSDALYHAIVCGEWCEEVATDPEHVHDPDLCGEDLGNPRKALEGVAFRYGWSTPFVLDVVRDRMALTKWLADHPDSVTSGDRWSQRWAPRG